MLRLGLPIKDTPLLLAVSGGPDSMGMAVLIGDWHKNLTPPKPHLSAVVVDHAIRHDSAAEAALVTARLNAMGIAATCHRVVESPPKTGLAVWARARRFEILHRLAMRDNATIIMAHHAEDQAETVQMRLEKSSGLRGLSGMADISTIGSVILARPFLSVPKAFLAAAAQSAEVEVAQDPTNHDQRYKRPQLRRDKALMTDEGIDDSDFLRLSGLARRITENLDTALEAIVPPLMNIENGGWGWFERWLLSCPESRPVLCHVIARLARRMTTPGYPPDHDAAAELAERLASGRDSTLAGCEWRYDKRWPEKILVFREAGRRIEPMLILDGTALFDGRWVVRYPHKATIEPMGARRFAAMRRNAATEQFCASAPPRAFWSLPVIVDDRTTNGDNRGEISGVTLDDGTRFPHLRNMGSSGGGVKLKNGEAGFIGTIAA